jgi:hypothetical protein
MTDWAKRRSEEGNAADVDPEWNAGGTGNQPGHRREASGAAWNPGGVGNQAGDVNETTDDEASDANWNPGGVGNATQDELGSDDDGGNAASAQAK